MNRGLWGKVAGGIAIVMPFLPLADYRANFYVDWVNSQWLAAYYGEFFRRHAQMPTALNCDHTVGMAAPLFYGYLLYPVLGLLARFLGAAWAVRCACVGLAAIQYGGLMAAGMNIFKNRALSYAVAVTVLWAIYPLTDLYNRSALPEYFATQSLIAAISFFAAAVVEADLRRTHLYFWIGVVCSALAVGCHPPTAVVAAPMLCVGMGVAAVLWLDQPGRRFAWSFPGALLLGGLIVAPWIYVSAKLARFLDTWAGPYHIIYYPERMDSLLARFLPFPYDPGSLSMGSNISTPYLETTMAFGLVLVTAWLLAEALASRATLRTARSSYAERLACWLFPITGVWTVFLIVLSLVEPVSEHFLILGPCLQFAYRLVGHYNAGLLLVALMAGILFSNPLHPLWKRRSELVAAICITLAGVGLGIKLTHAESIVGRANDPQYYPVGSRAALIKSAPAVLQTSYTTPPLFTNVPDVEVKNGVKVEFPVTDAGPKFGETSPVTVELAADSWVVTNVAAFPWCRLQVNGQEVPASAVRMVQEHLALRLPAGRQTLSYTWKPDPVWTVLHGLSLAALLVALGVICFEMVRSRSRPKKAEWPLFSARRAA